MNRTGFIGGADEAGRGCLLGPLVVAGVSFSPGRARRLRSLGVRDSKTLSPKKREALYTEILRLAEQVSWSVIPPDEIDEVVSSGVRLRKLNYLEAVHFARVIDRLGARKVTVDASDVIPSRFRDDIKSNMAGTCRVVAFHKADRDYPVVSAASIVAKVERDRVVDALRREHGEFGSGYPSDRVTRAFFVDRARRGESLPDYARKSWKTWETLGQSVLDAY